MGDRICYQPLTRWDKISVILYRSGIVLTCVGLIWGTALLFGSGGWGDLNSMRQGGIVVHILFGSAGLSTMFIHLYVSRFHKGLKRLFGVAAAGWALLVFLGTGNPLVAVQHNAWSALLLLPLAGCLGFVTVKEAFCFQLAEGYLLGLLLPGAVILVAAGAGSQGYVPQVGALVAGLYGLFTVRKVFMPLHADIGDKSAYQ